MSQLARSGNLEQEDGHGTAVGGRPPWTASVLRGHKSYVYPVAYSPDGQWIASGDWDNKVLLWDALTMENVASLPHPGNIRALAFSPDSSWLVVRMRTGRFALHIWNVATARRQNKLKGPGAASAQAIAVSPDGAHIAAADSDGTVSIMDAATGASCPFLSNGRQRLREEVASLQSRRTTAGRYG